jgi:hypothetical protein
MEYHGKLYGKIGNKYFDTEKTSKDFDDMLQMLKYILSEDLFFNDGKDTIRTREIKELLTKISEQ